MARNACRAKIRCDNSGCDRNSGCPISMTTNMLAMTATKKVAAVAPMTPNRTVASKIAGAITKITGRK